MKKPTDTSTILEVLAYYADTDIRKGKALAQYMDWLERCFAYTVLLTDDRKDG